MKWQTKARIQQLVSKLPPKIADDTYYCLQRYFGDLRTTCPEEVLGYGLAIVNLIRQQHRSIDSKTFLEIGTGRRVNLPLALWLCGAGKIITVDLNRYLKEQLIREDLIYIRKNPQKITQLFEDYAQMPLFQERFETLLGAELEISNLQKILNLEYLAPFDARYLSGHEFDFCVSNSVFEHVPRAIMLDILAEGKRRIRQDGLFVHIINFSDHFELSDKAIIKINFLKYSDEEWDRIAGNKYMYHNRMRLDDYLEVFNEVGLGLVSQYVHFDQPSLKALEAGFPVHSNFKDKTHEVNAAAGAMFVLSPAA